MLLLFLATANVTAKTSALTRKRHSPRLSRAKQSSSEFEREGEEAKAHASHAQIAEWPDDLGASNDKRGPADGAPQI